MVIKFEKSLFSGVFIGSKMFGWVFRRLNETEDKLTAYNRYKFVVVCFFSVSNGTTLPNSRRYYLFFPCSRFRELKKLLLHTTITLFSLSVSSLHIYYTEHCRIILFGDLRVLSQKITSYSVREKNIMAFRTEIG